MKKTPATKGRGPKGQFAPGMSGNLKGRPKSETVALRESLADGAADVVTAILAAAKAGDMQACKIVLDRLLPSLKATSQTVHLSLPEAASPLATARAILAATASGSLPPDVGAQLVFAVGAICRIEEIEEIRDRIAALEKATRPPITTNQKPKR